MPIDPDRSDDDVAAIVRNGYDAIADGYLASMRTTDTNDPRSAWVDRFLAQCNPNRASSTSAAVRAYRQPRNSTPPDIELSESTSRRARSHSPNPRFQAPSSSRPT